MPVPPPSLSARDRIRQRWQDPRWRWALFGVLALVLLVVLRACHSSSDGSGRAGRGGGVQPVAVAAAHAGDMPVYLDALGTVTAYYTVTLHSRVDGQLMSVPVREGQVVDKGQLLAQIDPRPFQAALDQAEGLLARDQALLSNALVDLQRYQGLITQDAIPQQQLATQQALVVQDSGTVKTDEAAVENAQLNLDYARITAPISGRIGLRAIDPGNQVHAADVTGLLAITQTRPITVIFTLPEDDLGSVLEQMAAQKKALTVVAYNRDKTVVLSTGTLMAVDNQIDPTTGTSKLKAVFKNDDEKLFPNQFVNVRLLLDTRANQVIVPAVAIQRGSQGAFVYVLQADHTVENRPVTVGVTEGMDVSVDKGLNVGEQVVIDGVDKLQPGSKVSVPGTNPTSGAPADAAAAPHKHGKHHPQQPSS